MSYRPKPKYASKTPGLGSTWVTCDQCGFQDNMQNMQFQYDFLGGSSPKSTGFLKCPRCLDPLTFQRQLIVIPPDPPMVFNTRPEVYAVDEAGPIQTSEAVVLMNSAINAVGVQFTIIGDNLVWGGDYLFWNDEDFIWSAANQTFL